MADAAASAQPATPERVGRGVAFAAGAIPIGAVAAGILGWFDLFPAVCIFLLVSVAFSLYRQGRAEIRVGELSGWRPSWLSDS